MKRKVISKTYLRDVEKYEFRLEYDKTRDFYICEKNILSIEKPFVTKKGKTIMDNGYTILEITPRDENYNLRVYFNRQKDIEEMYFDITKENGIDECSQMPCYLDLYLDVIIEDGECELKDEDELKDALNNGIITQDDFNLAYRSANKLIKEIHEKTNKFINLDLKSLLKY